jgi:hypothetical protein
MKLKELDNARCAEYIKDRLKNLVYFSARMSRELNFSEGTFYTIIPDDINPAFPVPDYYEFRWGGRIFPWSKEEDVNIVQVFNHAGGIITESANEYVNGQASHWACVEEFIESPGSKWLNRDYYVADNKVVHLINAIEPDSNFLEYGNWGFNCLLLELDLVEGMPGQELAPEMLGKIYQSIRAFYVEVYDEESYLIWIKHPQENPFLKILEQNIPKYR